MANRVALYFQDFQADGRDKILARPIQDAKILPELLELTRET